MARKRKAAGMFIFSWAQYCAGLGTGRLLGASVPLVIFPAKNFTTKKGNYGYFQGYN